MSESPLVYSLKEASRLVGIGKTGLYREVKAGRLSLHKAGKRSLIRADELRRWLDSLPKVEAKAA
ncbi:MAG: helix-turn-helix domain-containing protein [Bradyrhizobiaceae bacterium]|nr:helix-turn-helix domain-containing protein [Bradyrhizobiaceae bacterium]